MAREPDEPIETEVSTAVYADKMLREADLTITQGAVILRLAFREQERPGRITWKYRVRGEESYDELE